MLIVIKGAGDIASGIALRLYRAGLQLVMTEIPQPTAIRRTVSFSPAVTHGAAEVEGVRARLAKRVEEVWDILRAGEIPLLVDPEAACVQALRPDALVDAILAKQNLGTGIADAPAVVAVGPGFTAGVDCHAVVETSRGHTLGRAFYTGSAAANTGVPGDIGGYTLERLLRAPQDGFFAQKLEIGATVCKGDVAATVSGVPMVCQIGGILRGILPDGFMVYKGMKCGDVDPRCALSHCYTVSDKALAVGGGVLEAVLGLCAHGRQRELKPQNSKIKII